MHDDIDRIEDQLRRDRSEPSQSFVDDLVARMSAETRGRVETPRARLPRFRFGLAVGFATVFLAVFSGFGGLGYAKNVAAGAAQGTGSTFKAVFGGGDSGGAQGGGGTTQTFRGGQDGGDQDGGDQDGGNHHNGPGDHQYPRFVLICIGPKDKPVVVPRKVAALLIKLGIAHAPPCGTRFPKGDD